MTADLRNLENFGTYGPGRPVLILETRAGANITDCLMEAIKIAIDTGAVVKYEANDREYIIDPEKFLQPDHWSQKIKR